MGRALLGDLRRHAVLDRGDARIGGRHRAAAEPLRIHEALAFDGDFAAAGFVELRAD